MEVVGTRVRHTTYGEGTIISQTNERMIVVSFLAGEKRFIYPDSFQSNLSAVEEETQQRILELLQEKKVEESKKLEEKRKKEQAALERERLNREKHRILFAKKKVVPKNMPEKDSVCASIAFKCAYNDGGKSDTQIGYHGLCSEEMIQNNVVIEKHHWCSHAQCLCKVYIEDEWEYSELKKMYKNGDYPCYESRLLQDWTANAGLKQYGRNAGDPMKIQNVQMNSLCVLTTKEPKGKEHSRFIFAVFVVGNSFEGNEKESGYVSAHPLYRLVLPPALAKKMLFWDYYSNGNTPKRANWNSTQFRYLNDTQSVHILRDLVSLTAGMKEEKRAKDMLAYYIKMNGLDHGIDEEVLERKAVVV